ncbi:hypothetical protein HY523_00675 [Candidatus Berkelbacteria bacterium]|nr:hypothetical protein [Candidatus Berkelbacteria bacterium]
MPEMTSGYNPEEDKANRVDSVESDQQTPLSGPDFVRASINLETALANRSGWTREQYQAALDQIQAVLDQGPVILLEIKKNSEARGPGTPVGNHLRAERHLLELSQTLSEEMPQ